MSQKRFDVLVVGELNVDLILNRLQQFPELGKEVLAGQMLLTLGSSSAIFASNLSALGSKVGFCGRLGDDNFGEKIIHDLSAKGVNTDHISRSSTEQTGITVALNVAEDRAMVTYPGAMEELAAEHITGDMLSSASHLHVSSAFLQPGLRPSLPLLFKNARDLGLTTSFDPQWDPSERWELDLDELLPHVNVFLPNIGELRNLTGGSSLEDCLALLKDTAQMTVVKMGSEGAVLWTNGEMIRQPPFLNRYVVDAIGAGDSFNAGFIHRFIRRHTVADCLEFAALCGAINTTAAGGTTAFDNYDSISRIAKDKFNFQI